MSLDFAYKLEIREFIVSKLCVEARVGRCQENIYLPRNVGLESHTL